MKKLSIALACLIAALPIEAAFAQVSSRSDIVGSSISGNGGQWGIWTEAQYCPGGSWASSFGQRVEPSQGGGDDTALNSVVLFCTDRNGNQVGSRVTPHQGFWGTWAYGRCSQGRHMTKFALKVEGSQGGGDDTSANAINFWCNDGTQVSASNDGAWGNWGGMRGNYPNAAICGIQEKIESQQGGGDDTALNDVKLIWCRR